MMLYKKLMLPLLLIAFSTHVCAQKKNVSVNPKVKAWKDEVMRSLDNRKKTAQEMVDMVFSFSELGFQETESRRTLSTPAAWLLCLL